MGKYGFNISFDGEVEKLVNQAVFSIGAYYAYGRIGMLIVIPEQSRIVYVYNGWSRGHFVRIVDISEIAIFYFLRKLRSVSEMAHYDKAGNGPCKFVDCPKTVVGR